MVPCLDFEKIGLARVQALMILKKLIIKQQLKDVAIETTRMFLMVQLLWVLKSRGVS